MNSTVIGDFGETFACRYLQQQGYKIIERKFCVRGGEIDIIATKQHYIVFIEVKTRNENFIASPKQSITKSKKRRIILTAITFLKEKKLASPMVYQPRFDLFGIVVDSDDPQQIKNFEHIISAFNTEGLDVFI